MIIKILVYGAGVIGSFFALKLKQGGNDVSILARGKRLEDLKKYGIVIQDDIFHKEYKTDINVVDCLKPDDKYDVVLVIMQIQQVNEILPILKENISPTIIFTGNNPAGAKEYLKSIEKERILLGFGGPGGYREDYKIIGAYIDKTILYVGELDGQISDRLRNIEKVFTESGIVVDLQDDIDAWLISHAALIAPLAMGSYAAKNRNNTMGSDSKMVELAIKAYRENIKALKELDIQIVPKKLKLLARFPLGIVKRKLLKLFNSDFGRIALAGHADAAKDEMIRISEDFLEVVRNVKTDMSSNKKLYDLSFA